MICHDLSIPHQNLHIHDGFPSQSCLRTPYGTGDHATSCDTLGAIDPLLNIMVPNISVPFGKPT